MIFSKSIVSIVIFLVQITLFTPVGYAGEAGSCPEYPYFKPSTGPLAAVNCDFHRAYDNRADEIMKTLGASGGRPVILNLGGNLVFKHNDQTETEDAAPERLHLIKAFAHSMFATELVLHNAKNGPLSPETKEQLTSLQEHLSEATGQIDGMDLDVEQKRLLKNSAQHHLQFMNELLTSNTVTQDVLKQFFAQNRAELENIIKTTALIQLSLIDQAVNQWLNSLTDEERAKLGVVVATVHQARGNELSLQYFAKKFGFKYGVGAQYENGFVILEGKFDEESALKLLARHYLDRQASTVMFDDPERLQSDILGIAAKDILATSF